MRDGQETPVQEAMSVITIVAIVLGILCYVAASKNVPVASPILFWIASEVYQYLPALYRLPGANVPYLVAGGTVGLTFYVLAMPFAPWIARTFDGIGIASIDRQTRVLKRRRDRQRERQRQKDRFRAE